MKKILLVASHGGHWVQLRRLSTAFNEFDIHYVCTTKDVKTEVYPNNLYVVRDANLNKKIDLFILFFQLMILVFRVKPDYILSTGAAPGFLALLNGKIFGAKTIWVDSIANADTLSVSGRKVRYFADLWLTQWPNLSSKNGPDYKGALL